MKKLLFLLSGMYLFLSVQATEVDTITARTVAKNFLAERLSLKKGTPPGEVQLRLAEISRSGDTVFCYVYKTVGQKGFVVISADDRVLPVLAYSLESSFGDTAEMPPALKEWLAVTVKQLRYVKRERTSTGSAAGKVWKKYLSPPAKGVSDVQEVPPLLTTKWNQGKYYNALCPEDPKGRDGHTWVGCVAVAMAQVMKYWDYPDYGSGEYSYDHYLYGEQSADFANTFYDWPAMPDALTDYNTPVATLMYHCGVSVRMNYGTSGSSAYTSSTGTALKKYYDYSREIISVRKWSYTDHAWDSLVRSQLDLGQPLIYSGGSHAFNIDGYQDTSYFHVNWGWGGAYNGYFFLNDLTPGSYDFTSGQHAVINIRPGCGEAPTETDTVTAFSGTLFDNGGASDNYYNCSDSRTLIAPAGAAALQLVFREFGIIAGQDTLYVYDGQDENAPLLAALSGDTVPPPLVSSGGKVLLHFVSDQFTTEKGYEIQYTCAFDDAGVTQILLPQSRTCGREDDSLVVVVKNYGINTQTQIPVRVEIHTPRGDEIYTARLQKMLAQDEQDTLYIGGFSTMDPGEYSLSCYTTLAEDTMINDNDTASAIVEIKFPQPVPFYENVDDLGWDMGDWVNAGDGWVWISRGDENGGEGYDKEGNAYFAGMVSSRYNHFFYYDRVIEGVTSRTGLWFDYRIMDHRQWPPAPDTLNNNERVHVVVSTGCDYDFDTVYTIDMSNHLPDTLFRSVYVPLGAWAGRKIMVGFTSEWDTLWAEVQYDNIVVLDSIVDNSITGGAVCAGDAATLAGTLPAGGIGPLSYLWQESSDSVVWQTAAGDPYGQNYISGAMTERHHFRRIVRDTLRYADTSNVVRVEVIPWPVPDITADTAICLGDTVILTASGGESYHWNTGENAPSLTVSPAADTKYTVVITNGGQCAVDTSVMISVHPLPAVSLGSDTSVCQGESVLLDAGTFVSWRWNTGETSQSITVDTAGSYSVIVQDLNGCENSDTLFVEFHTCTGMNGIARAMIRIYPNPTQGTVYLRGLLSADIKAITVLSIGGRIIRQMVPDSDIVTLDLRDQPAGIYLIRMIDKNGRQITQMINKE